MDDIRKHKKDPSYHPTPVNNYQRPINMQQSVRSQPVKPQPVRIQPTINTNSGREGKASSNSSYCFLIGEWSKNSNLTEQKLTGLIQSNRLDKKYGITVADVLADIKAYKAGCVVNRQRRQTAQNVDIGNKSERVSTRVTKNKSIRNRREYSEGLNSYIVQYKDKAFLEENIYSCLLYTSWEKIKSHKSLFMFRNSKTYSSQPVYYRRKVMEVSSLFEEVYWEK